MTAQMQANPQVQYILECFGRMNAEGQQKLVDYADTLVKTGKHTPKTIRLSWVRRCRTAGMCI